MFLTAIVVVAVGFGLGPSLLASAVAALSYNFFFTEPFYTFSINDPRDVIAVVFFTDRRGGRVQRRRPGADSGRSRPWGGLA